MSVNICGDFTRSVPHERLESGHRCFPAVEAKDEFAKVGLQILRIKSMMSAIEPRFEIAKSQVEVRSPHSWILPVPIFRKCRFGVPSPPVGPNHRDLLDILHQKNCPINSSSAFAAVAKRMRPASQQSPCACQYTQSLQQPQKPVFSSSNRLLPGHAFL